MYKYKLVQRSNPLVKGSPKKWYASPLSEAAQTVKAMTRAATENTTVAPKEMEAALELLGNYARQQLLQGHTVRVGDLGTLRITFKSDGVEDITKYNASAMIKEPRILFMPSREFREAVPVRERRRAGRRRELCLARRLQEGQEHHHARGRRWRRRRRRRPEREPAVRGGPGKVISPL